jgi:arylsulfatase A-like enzyme/Tfp pilus assembly protein PilF
LSRLISRRQVTAAAGMLLGVAVSAVWLTRPHTSPPGPHHQYGPNVLLMTVDTLRADAVGAYGRTSAVTPWMDRLASAGVRFTAAHAHNVVTLPSHANILSGRLPPDHGVRDNGGFRFPATLETLATLLHAQGYRTGAFVSAFPLAARFGLNRGFDEYDDRFAGAARPAFLIQERSGRDTVARALAWLATQADDRWFCWVHIYEPHFPYAPPEPLASRFAGDAYHGEVAAADAALGPLVQPILDAGANGRTLVVLTADHGEALGDHGEATHGVFAYEATLRVPLVIYQPRLFAAMTVAAPVQHVDLLPTILDALALPVPPGLPGQSLVPLLEREGGGFATDRATYFEALSASFNRGWAPLAGVLRGGAKYIDLPIPELYDLTADPAEERNLAFEQSTRIDTLRAALDGFRTASLAAPQPESAETRERLRSLGYLAVGRSPSAHLTEADDPKRLIPLDAFLQDIVTRYLDGDLDGAVGRCQELIQRRPEMPVSYMYLAHIERERGRLAAAVDALRRAVALAPDNAEMAALYGAYLTQAGRPAEASAMLEQYEQRHGAGDVEVLTSHALAQATAGRTVDAIATLQRAREVDPSNAMLAVNAGTVRLMAGDREAARREFDAALRANPDTPRAHSSLGILDLEDQRFAEAASHWRAATAIDTREFQTILAAAFTLHRAGKTAEARAALEFFVANAPPSRYAADIERARVLLAAAQ